MTVQRFWQEIHHCFDPIEAVAVDQPELHAERDVNYNVIARLERRLSVSTRARHRWLLTGAVGNGKSSELNYCAAKLTRNRVVVVLDLWEHMRNRVREPKALDRMQMWELLGLIGLAICRAGADHLGHRWEDEPKVLEKALAALRESDAKGGKAEIDVLALARGMTVAVGGVVAGPLVAVAGEAVVETGMTMLKSAADAVDWTWKIGLGDSKRRGDQEGEVRAVLNAVNRLIGSLHEAYGRSLLLIVDGLDRIDASEQIKALFVDSTLLGELICDQLLTAPLKLMRRQGPHVDRFELEDLYNIPVLRREDPRQLGPGVGFFHDLVARRVAFVRRRLAVDGLTGPAEPLPPPIVDRLAYYSGGVARDFVHLVRDAAFEALADAREQVDDAIVDVVLREARRRKEYYIAKDQIALLEQVMNDPDHALPDGDVALELLTQKRLLAYPNKTTWYFPHPILTLALLEFPPG
ncbi:MAG: hypothetical protein R6X02_04010 [Enhygromyxa sp.]